MIKITCLLSLLFLVSCIKTAEQVNREKRVESMSEQMESSQGLMTDILTQIKDMQGQLDKLNGRVEELEHRQKILNPDQINKMSESVALVQSQQQTQGTQLEQIQNELKEQRGFLEKVTTSLSSMGKPEKSSSSKKKSARGELDSALALVKGNQYEEAREALEGLIGNDELTPGDNNKLFHGLGRVEFFTKNYEKALVSFTKIYPKYPKASLAASSLLFIGRCLEKMDKKDEAKEAFSKLIEDYPGTKEAAEAKKEM